MKFASGFFQFTALWKIKFASGTFQFTASLRHKVASDRFQFSAALSDKICIWHFSLPRVWDISIYRKWKIYFSSKPCVFVGYEHPTFCNLSWVSDAVKNWNSLDANFISQSYGKLKCSGREFLFQSEINWNRSDTNFISQSCGKLKSIGREFHNSDSW